MESRTTFNSARAAMMFRLVSEYAVIVLAFLLPLFFLPWTTEAFEMNKQLLLTVFVSIAGIAALGAMLSARKFSLRSGLLNVTPLVFLGAVVASAVASGAGYQAWIGQQAQEYTSVLTVVAFVFLFYVLMNVAHETSVQRRILFALLLSATLSGLYALLAALGVLPGSFGALAAAGFNPVGTINAFAIYLLVVSFVGLALFQVADYGAQDVIGSGPFGIAMRAMIVVLTLLTLFFLVAIDFWVFWAFVIAGVALLAVFPIARTRAFPHPKRFALPALAAVVAVVFLFFTSPLRLNLPLVVTPSYRSSWNVARQAVTINMKTLAFGTGPGSFASDFARFKPVEVNQTAFWQSRFDRSKSHLVTVLATTGLVGLAAVLLFGLALALRALSRLLVERDREEWRMTYVFFVGWALLALVHIFYTSNLTLQFLFWAFSGLLASQVAERAVGRRFAEAPKASLAASFLFVLLCAGLFAGACVSAKRLSADAAFARAVMLDQGGAPVEKITGELVQAVQGNPLSDAYHRNLSQALLLDAANVIKSAGGEKLSDDQNKQLSALVSESVNQARIATDLAPTDVANWVARGAVYRDLMSFVGNAEDYAAASFERAAVLEPANPEHYANLGRVHLLVSERANQIKNSKDVKDADLKKQAAAAEIEQLRAAEQSFATSVQLKPDYAPAHYYLAVVYERQGRLADAAARLVVLTKANPSDLNLAFQLGVLQLRLKKFADAQKTFEAILKASPDNSNVMWFLASALELNTRQADAIKLVERVKELNPENDLVNQRLERMRAGEITTVIPAPVEEGSEVKPTDVETPPTADASASEPVTDVVDGAAATP